MYLILFYAINQANTQNYFFFYTYHRWYLLGTYDRKYYSCSAVGCCSTDSFWSNQAYFYCSRLSNADILCRQCRTFAYFTYLLRYFHNNALKFFCSFVIHELRCDRTFKLCYPDHQGAALFDLDVILFFICLSTRIVLLLFVCLFNQNLRKKWPTS